MNFSKSLVAVLSTTILLGACGNSADKPATPAKDTTAAAPASTANDKGFDLIASSDCTTCHRLHKESSGASIGPAYDEVAAKYSPAADSTVDRIVKKIITGGSGIWGAVPMTAHTALKPEDVKSMVTYILSLKK
jgi:cytochrome c